MSENYSVLMSVYYKEKPEFLREAMQSMFDQTIPTNDFVLVCDGPLTKELDSVIEKMQREHSELHVVRLKENSGLGNALRIGVMECKNEYIARMDSDDISKINRCKEQLKYLNNHPEISIVGSHVEEFENTVDNIVSKRIVPENNDAILKFAQKRNPFNHPTVMYRKDSVLKAGNYSNVRYIQDYYLWIDMFSAEMKGYNMQEPLVYMRVDDNLYKRRSGRLYIKIQIGLLKKMRESGLINWMQCMCLCIIRICSSIAPNELRKYMFKKILREC